MKSIEELIASMTLEEKVSLLNGENFWRFRSVERLGIPSIWVSDGPHGLRKQPGDGSWVPTNDSVPAVAFPTAAALACSYDRELVREVGEALGDMCCANDVAVLLGPGMNIKRSPLCGRNFEYFSEDPYLAGEMATAHIRGVQSKNVGTSLKHFALNDQENRRMTVSVECDERTKREIYLAGFERAVKQARPWTVMCAYNRIGGVYASENKRLLTDILRDEWGFDGCTITDWGACSDHVAGIRAGMDVAMPGLGTEADAEVVRAVREGRLDEADVDRRVAEVLRLIERTEERGAASEEFSLGAQHHLARKVARECAVLLKNDGMLPLRSAGTTAFIGEFAESPRFQGGGSSHITAAEISSALDAVRSVAAVEYARGYVAASSDTDEALLAEAVALAGRCDNAVLFVGLPDEYESEGYDRRHMRMPANQLRLIEAVAAVNPNTCVVLHNGSPVEAPWADSVNAILEMYLGGEAVGAAAVDLLYGAVSPCGKLAETFPIRLQDNPSYLNFPGDKDTVSYREGLYVGYRWYDARELQVRWPFGYGLSYTSFEYSDLRLSTEVLGEEEQLVVSVDITNTGRMGAKETVQLYVHSAHDGISRPVQELKGFEKIYLAPKKTQTVSFVLDRRAFSYYNTDISDWYAEAGAYELRVGASSRDIRLTATVVLESRPLLPKRVDLDTCCGDAMQIPGGAEVFERMLAGVGGMFDPEAVANDGMLEEQLRYLPIRCINWFSGGSFTHEMERALLEALNALI